jgi:hypothetical protein
MLEGIKALAVSLDVDTSAIEETEEYYHKLQQLRPERSEDIEKGIRLRKDFLSSHSFSEILAEDNTE